ncbi:MAG: hypothetical protein EPN39_20455 [Chitinophagaceae bacterium]|nr:MAG: hypothetical protein EPN39_20455 [Chitinophagaceae bacterium]
MKQPIPYQFGISNQPLKPFDVNEQKARRLEKLLKMKGADLIVKICKHYICNFIPNPVENENEYWIISCFPSTDHSPVRVSIWFPEVFNIHLPHHYYNYTQNLRCMVFVHRDYLDSNSIRELEHKIKGLQFHPEYRFQTGISEQLAAFLPITSYFSFIEDERIFESIRAHNYELTLKGRTPFKKGHNYALVRYLLQGR